MAEVTTPSPTTRKRSAGKVSTRIDMTPMVDLAFLLVTFFMLTTTFSKPRAMVLNMPIDDEGKSNVPASRTTTIVLGKNDRIYYYTGITDPQVAHTDFSAQGIRQVIAQKRRTMSREPIFIIKTTEQARYRNLVDILDEMSITGARHYSLVKITPADLELVSRYQQMHGIAR